MDLARKARLGAERLREGGGGALAWNACDQLGVNDMALVSGSGQVLLVAGGGTVTVAPSALRRPCCRRRAAGVASAWWTAGRGRWPVGVHRRARYCVPARRARHRAALARQDERYLLLEQPLSKSLALNALAVQGVGLANTKQARRSATACAVCTSGTLTLALILAVFWRRCWPSCWARSWSKPLLVLADGVRQGGRRRPDGPLRCSPRATSSWPDAQNFADMTAQLAETRAQVQRGGAARRRTHAAADHLDTLTAGVIVLDREGRIDTVNPGATRILRACCSPLRAACRLVEVPELEVLALNIDQRFELLRTSPKPASATTSERATSSVVATAPASDCWCGAHPPGGTRLLVFDDISDVVSAQRSAACRGGAPPGTRDQEPAHAHPAVGRTPAPPAGKGPCCCASKASGWSTSFRTAAASRGPPTIVSQVQRPERALSSSKRLAIYNWS